MWGKYHNLVLNLLSEEQYMKTHKQAGSQIEKKGKNFLAEPGECCDALSPITTNTEVQILGVLQQRDKADITNANTGTATCRLQSLRSRFINIVMRFCTVTNNFL